MCQHFYLTCVEIRFCYKLQQFFCSYYSSFSNAGYPHVRSAYLFFKYDVPSEYLTPFWFAMLLNEYEIEFMFRKIRNIRNLGNVYIIEGPHIVMSRTDAQNGLDFHFKMQYCIRFTCPQYSNLPRYFSTTIQYGMLQ